MVVTQWLLVARTPRQGSGALRSEFSACGIIVGLYPFSGNLNCIRNILTYASVNFRTVLESLSFNRLRVPQSSAGQEPSESSERDNVFKIDRVVRLIACAFLVLSCLFNESNEQIDVSTRLPLVLECVARHFPRILRE
jgi:hypothetical protein